MAEKKSMLKRVNEFVTTGSSWVSFGTAIWEAKGFLTPVFTIGGILMAATIKILSLGWEIAVFAAIPVLIVASLVWLALTWIWHLRPTNSSSLSDTADIDDVSGPINTKAVFRFDGKAFNLVESENIHTSHGQFIGREAIHPKTGNRVAASPPVYYIFLAYESELNNPEPSLHFGGSSEWGDYRWEINNKRVSLLVYVSPPLGTYTISIRNE